MMTHRGTEKQQLKRLSEDVRETAREIAHPRICKANMGWDATNKASLKGVFNDKGTPTAFRVVKLNPEATRTILRDQKGGILTRQ